MATGLNVESHPAAAHQTLQASTPWWRWQIASRLWGCSGAATAATSSNVGANIRAPRSAGDGQRLRLRWWRQAEIGQATAARSLAVRATERRSDRRDPGAEQVTGSEVDRQEAAIGR